MERKELATAAFRLSVIYLVMGAAWILLSDKALEALVSDRELYERLQTYKGWFYVLVTSVLLGFFAYAEFSNKRRLRALGEERARRYQTFLANSPDGALFVDASGSVALANAAAGALLGYSGAGLRGRRAVELLAPEAAADARDVLSDPALRLAGGLPYIAELPLLRADGAARWFRVLANPHFEDGAYAGVQLVLSDAQERRDAEQRTRADLAEKEALLRELNHRVKNNLQLLGSLISLRLGRLADSSARDLMSQQLARLRILSLVYDRFRESKSKKRIDFSDYLRDAAAEYSSSFPDRDVLFLAESSCSAFLPLDAAVPLALAVDEAVQNAVLHAFGAEPGRVVLSASLEGSLLRVRVEDDGVGFDPERVAGDTVGLMVLDGLAAQLGGALEIRSPANENGRGTRVEFSAPAAGPEIPA